MENKLKLNEDTMPLAQLEVLIKILAHQKATISILCDKFTDSEIQSNELFEAVLHEAGVYFQQVYDDLFAKYSSLTLKDILPKK